MNESRGAIAGHNQDQLINDKQTQSAMIYDMTRDEVRPVTQADVERLQTIEKAYGATRYILRRLFGSDQTHYAEPIDWNNEASYLRLIAQKIDDLKLKHGR